MAKPRLSAVGLCHTVQNTGMNAKQDSAGQISNGFNSSTKVTAIQGISIKYNFAILLYIISSSKQVPTSVCAEASGTPWLVVVVRDIRAIHTSELRAQHQLLLVVVGSCVVLPSKCGCMLAESLCCLDAAEE